MKYNLSIPHEAKLARDYFEKLAATKNRIEVRRIVPNRSLPQNNYLHLLLTAFGQHFGYTLDEAKTLYKRSVNPDIYVYEKAGNKFLRSSSDLSTDDMTKSIDRFRRFSEEQGYPLPDATDTDWQNQLNNAVESVQFYL